MRVLPGMQNTFGGLKKCSGVLVIVAAEIGYWLKCGAAHEPRIGRTVPEGAATRGTLLGQRRTWASTSGSVSRFGTDFRLVSGLRRIPLSSAGFCHSSRNVFFSLSM